MSEIGNYQPNSHKAKAEANEPAEKKIEKVITGNVKTKKKGDMHKLSDVFGGKDGAEVKEYLVSDVLVPGIKKIVWEIVTGAFDMILFGGTGHAKKNTNAGYVSYNNYSSRREPSRDARPQARTRYSYDDLVLETRGDAEDVMDRLGEALEEYGMVTVADMYDAVGLSCNYTDNKYGWTNLRDAQIVRVRDGYMLKMPPAHPLT